MRNPEATETINKQRVFHPFANHYLLLRGFSIIGGIVIHVGFNNKDKQH